MDDLDQHQKDMLKKKIESAYETSTLLGLQLESAKKDAPQELQESLSYSYNKVSIVTRILKAILDILMILGSIFVCVSIYLFFKSIL